MHLRALFAALAVVIFLGLGFLNGLDLGQLVNIQSLVIVFGGLGLVVWLGFPPERIRQTWHSILGAFRLKKDKAEEQELLLDVLKLARIYRMHGPVALEKAAGSVKSDFLRYGAVLVAEGYDMEGLLGALEREQRGSAAEDMAQTRILRTLARLAPALGMAGTVISLMQVMQHLGNVESLGTSLGLALSSTLYGLMLGNLLFLPVSLKLEQKFEQEAAQRIMLTDALIGLHQAEHPLRIAERLNSYEFYCKITKRQKALKILDGESRLQQSSPVQG